MYLIVKEIATSFLVLSLYIIICLLEVFFYLLRDMQGLIILFHRTQVAAKYRDKIKVFYSSKCDSIEQLPGGGGIEVKASLDVGGKGGRTKVFRPRLLVGADGLKSTVSIIISYAAAVTRHCYKQLMGGATTLLRTRRFRHRSQKVACCFALFLRLFPSLVRSFFLLIAFFVHRLYTYVCICLFFFSIKSSPFWPLSS